MKNLKLKSLITLMVLMFVAVSCVKEDQTGEMTVKMTDAPADFAQVNVEIKEVWVHYDGNNGGINGWVKLETNAGVYNLLELRNDVTAVIANQSALAVGNFNQIRLILGENNYAVAVENGLEINYSLLLSSQDQTGLKINVNSEIKANQTLQVVLDFDAEASIVEQGNGEFRLKPVIHVESVVHMQ